MTLNLQRSADASLVVVGNAAPSEAPMGKGKHKMAPMDPARLAAQRAVNTKDYLVKEKGVDASRISVRTGTKGSNEADNYLVPAGASFDSEIPGTTAVSDTVKAQSRTAAPAGRRHHHKKAAAPAQ